ncbi:TIM barrel protein [Alpinimonas psychrophila]|uniref:Hydroxypyruvate isomerase n=1 Tax=Alpinimonas psychrophila TaxID=748908 RepID=A0A7W3PNE9_9MICO|nr:TIM barrel protein [Alpinimonas psychrophila]MBA8828138.1 hydroxypyruvate isomerase [Alpinimonas psychrophila]
MTQSFTLAVCAEMVYEDLPFVERVRILDSEGFAVEMWDSTSKDVAKLESTGIPIVSMTGYLEGSVSDRENAHRVIETAAELVETAKRLGCTRLVVHSAELVAGLAARPTFRPLGQMWFTARDTMLRLGDLGALHGLTFCLENLNTVVDHPGIPLARAKDTLEIIREVNHPNARMMLDLYHAQIGEGNLLQLIRDSLPWIGEIQVADVPGRGHPGTGEINFSAIAAELTVLGYEGTIGLEGWVRGDVAAGLDQFRKAFAVE